MRAPPQASEAGPSREDGEVVDSDDMWENLKVAKERSIETLTKDHQMRKLTSFVGQAASNDGGAEAEEDLEAFGRALSLAQEAFDVQAARGPSINTGYANIMDGALR